MAHSFDPSFFFSDDAQDTLLPDGKPPQLTDTMPAHYAWLSLNPNASEPSAAHGLQAQKHQQHLIEAHGLDERELQMMRDLKKTLQAETNLLMQRVGHWLKMFDPSLDVENPCE